jgi:hypothetical protein
VDAEKRSRRAEQQGRVQSRFRDSGTIQEIATHRQDVRKM